MEETPTDSISGLASMLRKAGNVALNMSIKFTITEDMLNEVIKSFDLVNEKKEAMSSSFHVVHNTIEGAHVISDVQFLYEYFQKVPTLKLSGSNVTDNVIDISCFKWLKYIEINNINLRRLKGLSNFRDLLEVIVCTRNLKELNEIFTETQADDNTETDDLLWLRLRSAYLSHNFISSLDTSFQYTPYLHTLDLSFNCLENVDNINYLPNLKNLNIAYNKLKQAPNFYGTICNKLQVLNLKYNLIESTLGLSLLVNLRELDLGYNVLLKHDALVPVANILSLQSLKLTGNPISYHPNHRTNTCRYLNNNTLTVAFYLDGKLLSYREKSYVGTIHPKRTAQRPHLVSQCSATGSTIVEKPRRIREATISDQTDDFEELTASIASVSSLITSQDHLEKKRTLEELRNKLGEMWLLGDSRASHGSPTKSPQFASTPRYDDVLMHAKEFVLSSNETFHDAVETTPVATNNDSSNDTYKEAVSDTPDPYSDGNLCESDSSDSLIDIGTGDDDLYFVTRMGETEQICLVVTDKFLAERDVVVDAKEHYRWDTDDLRSCKLVENDVVRLEFDRMRTDYKQRQYVVEDVDERRRLIDVLMRIIERRPSHGDKGKSYQCLKCNETFKLQTSEKYSNSKNAESLVCPACESDLIIEQNSSNVT